MAKQVSEWAKRREAEFPMTHCHCGCGACRLLRQQALDAAAEEVARVALRIEVGEGETVDEEKLVKRVLDKLGRG